MNFVDNSARKRILIKRLNQEIIEAEEAAPARCSREPVAAA
jgi:hypothetical protein